MIDKSVGDAMMALFKWGAILIVVFVPLGAWKAIELVSRIF